MLTNQFKYSLYVEPERCSSLKVNAGEVSIDTALISGIPKPLVVNDGVMVLVDFGHCLKMTNTIFLKLRRQIG